MAEFRANFKSLDSSMNASLPGKLVFGIPGESGGYYTITVTQPDKKVMRLTFTPSKDTMDAIAPVDIALPEGPKGEPGKADPEQVQQLVEDYLVANPPQATETDPTVPDWAKQPTKPSYTASEVGALSQNDLQSGVDKALAQAKASGEFDGVTPTFSIGTVETLDAGSKATASITGTVEKPVLNLGIPKGADGEGGGGDSAVGDFELVGEALLTEDADIIEITLSKSCSRILVVCKPFGSENVTDTTKRCSYCYVNKGIWDVKPHRTAFGGHRMSDHAFDGNTAKYCGQFIEYEVVWPSLLISKGWTDTSVLINDDNPLQTPGAFALADYTYTHDFNKCFATDKQKIENVMLQVWDTVWGTGTHIWVYGR